MIQHGLSVSSMRDMRTIRTYLSLSTSQSNVDEAASVQETLLGAALGDLLLLLLLDLYFPARSVLRVLARVLFGFHHSIAENFCNRIFIVEKESLTHLRSSRLDLARTGERAARVIVSTQIPSRKEIGHSSSSQEVCLDRGFGVGCTY